MARTLQILFAGGGWDKKAAHYTRESTCLSQNGQTRATKSTSARLQVAVPLTPKEVHREILTSLLKSNFFNPEKFLIPKRKHQPRKAAGGELRELLLVHALHPSRQNSFCSMPQNISVTAISCGEKTLKFTGKLSDFGPKCYLISRTQWYLTYFKLKFPMV